MMVSELSPWFFMTVTQVHAHVAHFPKTWEVHFTPIAFLFNFRMRHRWNFISRAKFRESTIRIYDLKHTQGLAQQ
jgi:hypothetical protein